MILRNSLEAMESSTISSSVEDKDIPPPTPPTLELTNDDSNTSTTSDEKPHHRPYLPSVVTDFVKSTDKGATTVYVSGPTGMIRDVREEVARCNDASKVWKGQKEARVELIHDERLE